MLHTVVPISLPAEAAVGFYKINSARCQLAPPRVVEQCGLPE